MNQNKHLIWKKAEKNKSKTKTNTNNDNINNDNNHNKQIVVINHDNNNIKEDIVNLKSMENNFIPKKTLLKSVTTSNNNEDNENDNVNNDNDIDNFIQKKTLLKSSNNLINNKIEAEESKEQETDNNENIIDLRSNLENIINSKYKHNNFQKNKNREDDIKNQINERMNNLKRFRYEGLFPEKTEPIHKKQINKFSKSIKNKRIFLSEFEKKRFIKALKNIFTERLGAHNIYIQNICSCGNLQKKLTAIVEKGNLTVYALTEVDCANNCVFYKNKKEYMRNINDVLNSIKNIKYENFHNKYKENL